MLVPGHGDLCHDLHIPLHTWLSPARGVPKKNYNVSTLIKSCLRAATRAVSSARVIVLVSPRPPGVTVCICKGLLWG